MGIVSIEYYAFASFLTGLICLIAIICKVLFANVKRQYKLLDEKETKLLELYRAVESITEDFNDQVKAATEEIKEYENRVALIAASITEKQGDGLSALLTKQGDGLYALPAKQGDSPALLAQQRNHALASRARRAGSGRARAANEEPAKAGRVIRGDVRRSPAVTENNDNGAVFQRFFDEAATQAPQTPAETYKKQTRSEAVLELAQEGKTDAQIASELGITQNEVKLIIGINVTV